MHHLPLTLLAGFARLQEVSPFFAHGVSHTTLIYFAQSFGLAAPAKSRIGALAPWRIHRAEEVMLEDLNADRSLAEVAQICGLSAGHFARAFRVTTGFSPHRWLLRRRVERAQELLEAPSHSLSEIALICGFSDQSHMTRVFRAAVGTSPGAWRRQRRPELTKRPPGTHKQTE